MATPWRFVETPERDSCKLSIPEGDVTLVICDCDGLPMFKLDIDQNSEPGEAVSMDVFSAENWGPTPPGWYVLHRGLTYRD